MAANRRPAPARAKRTTSPPKKRARRLPAVSLRWWLLGVAVVAAFLYYQPLASYFETRSALNERAAEVGELRQERARLQHRLAASATVAALAREARQLNLVRPGEKLFVVKGVKEWRRAHARAATVARDG